MERFGTELPDMESPEDEPIYTSFEEWNAQFDDQNLAQFLPEYQMTLGDFRLQIWEAENTESMTFDQLKTEMQVWQNENMNNFVSLLKE